VNIAAVTDAELDKNFYWKSITMQTKKREILCKIINCSKFFGRFKLDLKEHD